MKEISKVLTTSTDETKQELTELEIDLLQTISDFETTIANNLDDAKATTSDSSNTPKSLTYEDIISYITKLKTDVNSRVKDIRDATKYRDEIFHDKIESEEQEVNLVYDNATKSGLASVLNDLNNQRSLMEHKHIAEACNRKLKRINDFTLPSLEDKKNELLFKSWLTQVDDLLSSVGLTALTKMRKCEMILKNPKDYETLSHYVRTSDLYSSIKSKFSHTSQYDVYDLPDISSLSSEDKQKIFEAMYLVVLDVFRGLERSLYDLLKSSVKIFSYLVPEHFHPGALRKIYFLAQNEFYSPDDSLVLVRRDNFYLDGTFVMKDDEDPRRVIRSITEQAQLINTISGEIMITERDVIHVLRRCALKSTEYSQVITFIEKNNLRITLEVLQEQLKGHWDKRVQPNIKVNVVHANAASSSTHHSTTNLMNEENAFFVKHYVPKGCCFEFAKEGKCTKRNCTFKHVRPGDSPSDSNHGKNTSSAYKNTFSKKGSKSNFRKQLTKALSALHDSHSSEAESSELDHESIDSDGANSDSSTLSDSVIQAFSSILKKNKSRRHTDRSKRNRGSNSRMPKPTHPNKLSYKEKAKQLLLKERKDSAKKEQEIKNLRQQHKRLKAKLAQIESVNAAIELANSHSDEQISDDENSKSE